MKTLLITPFFIFITNSPAEKASLNNYNPVITEQDSCIQIKLQHNLEECGFALRNKKKTKSQLNNKHSLKIELKASKGVC